MLAGLSTSQLKVTYAISIQQVYLLFDEVQAEHLIMAFVFVIAEATSLAAFEPNIHWSSSRL